MVTTIISFINFAKIKTMKNTILALIAILFFASCSKKEEEPQLQTPQDQLPAITTTGANTAGCIINGKVLIPKNGINGTSGFPVYGLTVGAGVNFNAPIIGDDYWFVRIYKLGSIGLHYGIYVHINDLTNGVGSYNLGECNGESFADASNNPQIVVSEFYNEAYTGKSFYSNNNSGTITITRFDYPNGIYSGIFNAILHNKDNPLEKIQVTNGSLDINIATLNK
jgi:hypothetical protein